MSATVHILRVVRRVHFEDPAWREQQRRESWAQVFDDMAPPPRTRPIALASEQLIVGQRPEGK